MQNKNKIILIIVVVLITLIFTACNTTLISDKTTTANHVDMNDENNKKFTESKEQTQPSQSTSIGVPTALENNEASISFQLNIGNKKHYFLVNMEAIPMTKEELGETEFYDSKLKISIFSEIENIYFM